MFSLKKFLNKEQNVTTKPIVSVWCIQFSKCPSEYLIQCYQVIKLDEYSIASKFNFHGIIVLILCQTKLKK